MKATIGNASLMKDINKRLILNLIREQELISRADLVKITKLALPTVLRNVNELVEQGVIVETGKGETASGRKPVMLKINPSYGYYIGVGIGRRISVALADFTGHMIDLSKEDAAFSEGPEKIVEQIKEIVYRMIEANSVERDKVIGIGVATPGTAFKVLQGNEFVGWESVNFKQLLAEYIPDIPAKAEFNTICGAIGEQWFGLGKQTKNYVYVYVDSGVGSGIIIDNKVYRGKEGFAGHIGHHVINFDGDTCYCGNKGCLEMYTSTTAVKKAVNQRLRTGEASLLNRTGDKPGETPEVTPVEADFKSIIEAYNQGDKLVTEIIQYSGKILGIGIANTINIYDPEMVILGGEMCKSFPLFVEAAIQSAKENTFSLNAKQIDIAVSEIGRLPEVMGAIALVMDDYYKKPNL